MRRLFITNFIFFYFACFTAQKLNDSLLYYELKYFNSGTPPKQRYLIHKINLYLRYDLNSPNVVNEIRRVDHRLIDDTLMRGKFLWNGAVVSYLHGERELSANLLSNYGVLTKDTGMMYKFLTVLVHKYHDTVRVNCNIHALALRDSIFRDLGCFTQAALYERRHLNLYRISSAIVPGSGIIMNGNVGKGILAMTLTAASVYGVVALINAGVYINAALWGTGLGLKFYTGNIRLTEKVFKEKELKQKNKLATSCELKLVKILEKYPVNLKY
jgi:hypothetical protein